MRLDEEADVRLIVAQGLRPSLLHLLADDPDWRVRFEVARRTEDTALAARLAGDDDPMVCEAAAERSGAGTRPAVSDAMAGR